MSSGIVRTPVPFMGDFDPPFWNCLPFMLTSMESSEKVLCPRGNGIFAHFLTYPTRFLEPALVKKDRGARFASPS